LFAIKIAPQPSTVRPRIGWIEFQLRVDGSAHRLASLGCVNPSLESQTKRQFAAGSTGVLDFDVAVANSLWQ
jgi:hypothetical protein